MEYSAALARFASVLAGFCSGGRAWPAIRDRPGLTHLLGGLYAILDFCERLGRAKILYGQCLQLPQ